MMQSQLEFASERVPAGMREGVIQPLLEREPSTHGRALAHAPEQYPGYEAEAHVAARPAEALISTLWSLMPVEWLTRGRYGYSTTTDKGGKDG
jgi:hypothetical protein